MSDKTQPERRAYYPMPSEAVGLLFIGPLAVVIGIAVIWIGVASTGGGLLTGPDIGDLASRTAMVTIGTAVAAVGFIAIVGGCVINGIARVLRDTQSHRA